MIIVADSGATKTDWRVIKNDRTVIPFTTKGLNPFFSNEDDFFSALNAGFPSQLSPNGVEKVFFYGAGCAGEEKGYKAQMALQNFFTNSKSFAFSDLLAAARALFGNNQGVIAILGTGSNIAYYDGINTQHYTPSLGYVLGDEGSGAYIGKKILRSYFYNQLSAELAESFASMYRLDLPMVLDNIYIQPKPSSYLASFIPFVHDNIDNPLIFNIVKSSFMDLYTQHLSKIPELNEKGLGIIGSVGYIFRQIIEQIAQDQGFKIINFLQYPIENLVKFHIENDL